MRVLASGIWLAQIASGAAQIPSPPAGLAHQQTVNRYCVPCHNARTRTAGMTLDDPSLSDVAGHTEVWEKVVRKLRAGAMPPPGARRPDEETANALRTDLESRLDAAAAASPNPGRPLLHRLNRAEYGNAIRDLLSLDVDVASLLPLDNSSYGFDNISEALGVSPVLVERYLAAAQKVSALAVGDPDVSPGSDMYRARQDLSQDQHLEGLPLGTVGGLMVTHTFPLDAEYTLQVKLFRTNLNAIRGLEYAHELEITVDGERVYLGQVGGDADVMAVMQNPTTTSDAIDARLRVRVPVKAGPHAVGVSFLRAIAEGTRRLQPYIRSSVDTFDVTGRPHIAALTISGPFAATGPGDTPSRRRIFTCRPSGNGTSQGAARVSEAACARRIVRTLARRAYRRPVSMVDLEPLMSFYEEGRRERGFERGIQLALERILASPAFSFRAEPDPPEVRSGSAYRLGDLELVSRLSFFLWSSIPDDELIDLASRGRLRQPAVLEAQTRRMLADPRSQALVINFAGQWLQLRNLRNALPNSTAFPDFDDNLRQAFLRETELLFETVMRGDRSVLDLLNADYTFVNERSARHYGIAGVYGSQLRRVPVPSDARRGLLGQGSLLTVTSHADRTSPVLRGKWILENLLGTPPPPPPADVPPLKEDEEGSAPTSVRQRLEQHRANPVCAGCHKLMDPLGFALENFDAVGAWRNTDADVPIDASGQLVDGSTVDGVVALRQSLLKHPDAFVTTMTEKLLTYALGRGLTPADMPAVRQVVRGAAADDYRFAYLILGIVRSTPFQMKLKAAVEN